MENLILFVHLIIALVIIALIMLQQGKGAEMGASFGAGASQTLFGATGSGNFFAKLTSIFALLFFVTSFSLALIAKNKSQVDDDLGLPELESVELPSIEDSEATDSALPSVEENSEFNDANVQSDSDSDALEVELAE